MGMNKNDCYIKERIYEIIKRFNLEGGRSNSQIRKYLKVSKQLVNYHLRELISERRIFKYKEKGVTLYRVKSTGSQGGRNTLPGKAKQTEPVYFDNLHNVQFSITVRKDAPLKLPYKAIMNNVTREYGWLANKFLVNIVRNKEGKSISLDIRFRIDEEETPEGAKAKAWEWVHSVAQYMEHAFGFELGQPQMVRKPHYTIRGDPVAKKVKGAVYSENGHIDHSHDEGEVEYYNSKDVKSYIELPIAVRRLEEINKVILKSITVLADSQVVDKTIILKEIIKTIKKEG
jgi:hypothetical protein